MQRKQCEKREEVGEKALQDVAAAKFEQRRHVAAAAAGEARKK